MNDHTHQLDTSECEVFAKLWVEVTGTRHITLTAIPAAGGPTATMTFAVDAMRRWVERHQGQKRNIYFQVNETHPDCRKKPSKNEMIAVLCRHADVDPVDDLYPYCEERDRLHQLAEFLHNDGVMPPTFLLDSGNGIYPLWVVSRQMLTPGVLSAVEVENQAVEAAVGAAGTFNVDRLLRLPGTLNFPNAKKLKLGRGITRARVIHHSDKTYTAEQAAGVGTHLRALLRGSVLVRLPSEQGAHHTDRALKQPTAKRARRDNTRSAVALRKARDLRRNGCSFDEMCSALRDDPQTADWVEEKGKASNNYELKRLWDRSEPRGALIRIAPGDLHKTATQAEDAILKSGEPIFQRGKLLVRPISQTVAASHSRTTIIAALQEQSVPAMIDLLCSVAEWERYDARAADWVRASPPKDVANILLARQGRWRLPSIAGVITIPTLRPDGSLLHAAGYDPATRLFHIADPALRLHPEVLSPTKDAAARALKFLAAVLDEFPFIVVDKRHVAKAVALSAIVTTIVRGALTVAPLHGFRAHTPGAGKSYLADVASAILSGKPCPVISVATEEAETEKRLNGLLLAGYPLVSIDNCNDELGSDLLCQAVERPLIQVRKLGSSDIFEIENSATIFGNGNNLRVRGDLVRRTLLCDLDAKMERPELRQFKGDPVATILANRGAYVSAALIIVRAYFAAGQPGLLPPIVSYGDWSAVVRSALVWLGCADPAASMDAARSDDPELSDLGELLQLWADACGVGEGLTVVQVVVKAVGSGPAPGRPALRDALMRMFSDKGNISTRRLASWLMGHAGRIVNGQRFARHPQKAHGGAIRWMVEAVQSNQA